MKKAIISMALAIVAITASAQHEVRIERNGGVRVIKGSDRNGGVHIIDGRNPRVHKHHNLSLSFCDANTFDTHLPAFSFGMCSVTGASNGISVNMGQSYELAFYPLDTQLYTSWDDNFGVYAGLGFSWRNYRMTDDLRFEKIGGRLALTPYPAGANSDFSRIKTFSIEVPILCEWHINTDWYNATTCWVNVGPMINFTPYASTKTRYTIDGDKHKDVSKAIRQVPISADIYASAGIGDLGIYVRYSPFHVVQEQNGIRFSSLSCGVMLTF